MPTITSLRTLVLRAGLRDESARRRTCLLDWRHEQENRVPSPPDTIVLKRDRDLEGRQADVWIRRALFFLLPVVTVLALLNLFGQRPKSTTAAGPAAKLDV